MRRFAPVRAVPPRLKLLEAIHAFLNTSDTPCRRRASCLTRHPRAPITRALRLIAGTAGRHKITDFADVAGRSLVFDKWPQMIPIRRCRAAVNAMQVVQRHCKMREGLTLFICRRFDGGNDGLDEAVGNGRGAAGNLQWGTLFHGFQAKRGRSKDQCRTLG